MRKATLKYVALLVFPFINTNAQQMFQKTYQTNLCNSNSSRIQDFFIDSTENIYAVGRSGCLMPPVARNMLLKFDSLGSVQWSRYFTGTINTYFRNIISMDTSIYIFGSYKNSGICTTTILRTDTTGNPLWAKKILMPNSDFLYDVIKTKDNCFAFLGTCRDTFNTDSVSIFLMKTDKAGNTLWTKKYSGALNSAPIAFQQSEDNGFIIPGTQTNNFFGCNDMFVFKTDSMGVIQWSYKYDFGCDESITAIVYKDSTIYLAGSDYTSNPTNQLYFKLDYWGNILQSKFYHGGDNPVNIILNKNNELVYLLRTAVLITDTAGNFSSYKKYLIMPSSGYYSKIHESNDGGYFFAGGHSFNTSDLYMVKIDSLGNAGCNQYPFPFPDSAAIVGRAPQPFIEENLVTTVSLDTVTSSLQTITTITWCQTATFVNNNETENEYSLSVSSDKITISSNNKITSIKIYNVMGQLMLRENVNSMEAIISIINFKSGMYIAEIFSVTKINSVKFIKF